LVSGYHLFHFLLLLVRVVDLDNLPLLVRGRVLLLLLVVAACSCQARTYDRVVSSRELGQTYEDIAAVSYRLVGVQERGGRRGWGLVRTGSAAAVAVDAADYY
jgi:hypothetical protein